MNKLVLLIVGLAWSAHAGSIDVIRGDELPKLERFQEQSAHYYDDDRPRHMYRRHRSRDDNDDYYSRHGDDDRFRSDLGDNHDDQHRRLDTYRSRRDHTDSRPDRDDGYGRHSRRHYRDDDPPRSDSRDSRDSRDGRDRDSRDGRDGRDSYYHSSSHRPRYGSRYDDDGYSRRRGGGDSYGRRGDSDSDYPSSSSGGGGGGGGRDRDGRPEYSSSRDGSSDKRRGQDHGHDANGARPDGGSGSSNSDAKDTSPPVPSSGLAITQPPAASAPTPDMMMMTDMKNASSKLKVEKEDEMMIDEFGSKLLPPSAAVRKAVKNPEHAVPLPYDSGLIVDVAKQQREKRLRTIPKDLETTTEDDR